VEFVVSVELDELESTQRGLPLCVCVSVFSVAYSFSITCRMELLERERTGLAAVCAVDSILLQFDPPGF
jgi:hypothetical protein